MSLSGQRAVGLIVALLPITVAACFSEPGSPPQERTASKGGSEQQEPPTPAVSEEESPASTRTVVLHVTGMMKSKGGAT